MCAGPRRRPSPRDFLTNLTVDMPWPRKLRLLARNAFRRLVRLRDCCGHPGEPGC